MNCKANIKRKRETMLFTDKVDLREYYFMMIKSIVHQNNTF